MGKGKWGHLGHNTTLDLRAELEAAAGLSRLESDSDVGELARPAGLLLVYVVDVRSPADGLSVVDLGCAHITVHLELSPQPVHNDAAQHMHVSISKYRPPHHSPPQTLLHTDAAQHMHVSISKDRPPQHSPPSSLAGTGPK